MTKEEEIRKIKKTIIILERTISGSVMKDDIDCLNYGKLVLGDYLKYLLSSN